MKNLQTFSIALCILVFIALGCSMSTANMSSFKVGKDKAVSSESANFKPGDTIYGIATISNNPGKVKVNLYVADSTGKTLPGSEVSLNIDGDNTANYSLPLPDSFEPGTYKVNADMLNESGEKKDSKSVNITVAE